MIYFGHYLSYFFKLVSYFLLFSKICFPNRIITYPLAWSSLQLNTSSVAYP